MLNVIIIMTLGIVLGAIFNKKTNFIRLTEKLTTYAIWLLLFLLGLSIGTNEVIINNIGSLGIQALILSLSAIVGSVFLSYLLYIYLFKHER